MAFDVNNGEAVIFGGVKGVVPIAETWTFSGTDWTQKSPATSPSNRAFPAMAYHAASNEVILFGGLDGAAMPTSDTWSWNGTNWTNKMPVTTPPARYWTALAYDANRQKTVMFGGFENIGPSALSDVWEWDGTDWTQITPAPGPSARFTHRMSYDSTLEKIVLFGGSTLTDPLNETWTWDGTTWEQLSPGTAPSARSDHGQVFDAQSGKTVIFGGATGTGVLNETWTFGAAATPAPTATPTPTPTPEMNLTLSNVTVRGPKKVKVGKKATYKVKGDISKPGTVKVTVKGKGVKGKSSVMASGSWILKIKFKARKRGKIRLKFRVQATDDEGNESQRVAVTKRIRVK
jgi:hypothetical protein